MWPELVAKLRHQGMVHPAEPPNKLPKVGATRLAAANGVELVGRNVDVTKTMTMTMLMLMLVLLLLLLMMI